MKILRRPTAADVYRGMCVANDVAKDLDRIQHLPRGPLSFLYRIETSKTITRVNVAQRRFSKPTTTVALETACRVPAVETIEGAGHWHRN